MADTSVWLNSQTLGVQWMPKPFEMSIQSIHAILDHFLSAQPLNAFLTLNQQIIFANKMAIFLLYI